MFVERRSTMKMNLLSKLFIMLQDQYKDARVKAA
jgi:hypothetical protein